jgi:hypothetical protein
MKKVNHIENERKSIHPHHNKNGNSAIIASKGNTHVIKAIDKNGCLLNQTIQAKTRGEAIAKFTMNRWRQK